MDYQISPIPQQICLSLLSLRFHYLLPFSIWSDELSKHIFAEQKTPSQCSMDRFPKEPSFGFDEQRRQSLTVHAESTRCSWRFTNRFHFSEKPLRFYFLNSGSITATSLSPHPPLHLPAASLPWALAGSATLLCPTPLLQPGLEPSQAALVEFISSGSASSRAGIPLGWRSLPPGRVSGTGAGQHWGASVSPGPAGTCSTVPFSPARLLQESLCKWQHLCMAGPCLAQTVPVACRGYRAAAAAPGLMSTHSQQDQLAWGGWRVNAVAALPRFLAVTLFASDLGTLLSHCILRPGSVHTASEMPLRPPVHMSFVTLSKVLHKYILNIRHQHTSQVFQESSPHSHLMPTWEWLIAASCKTWTDTFFAVSITKETKMQHRIQ